MIGTFVITSWRVKHEKGKKQTVSIYWFPLVCIVFESNLNNLRARFNHNIPKITKTKKPKKHQFKICIKDKTSTPTSRSSYQCSIKKLFLKFRNIHRKTPLLESSFNKVADLKEHLFWRTSVNGWLCKSTPMCGTNANFEQKMGCQEFLKTANYHIHSKKCPATYYLFLQFCSSDCRTLFPQMWSKKKSAEIPTHFCFAALRKYREKWAKRAVKWENEVWNFELNTVKL